MNWGKGITIAMIAFMGFIGSMVYIAFTKNADLVRDDYYENELAFDQNKEDKANYKALESVIHVEKNEQGVSFLFPIEMNEVEGSIEFYRPDQKKFDRKFDLAMNDNQIQSFTYDNFVDGYYEISVSWKNASGKGYIFESNILF